MKNIGKKLTAAALAVAVTALGACAPSVSTQFDEVRPWHDGIASYEKLVFDTVVYDTSEENKYTTIGTGKLTFVLTEDFETTSGNVPYTKIEMTSYVTYNDSAPERDRGKTDEITSYVDFQTSGLAARKMNKTVTLAARDGIDNLSYTVTADYFGERKVTRTWASDGQTQSLDTAQGTKYYDNEMLFYLARATKLGFGTSASINAVNVFDTFNRSKPKLQDHSFNISVSQDPSVIVFEDDENNWVKNFGIKPVKAEDGKITYPVPCYLTGIILNTKKSGPPYTVHYASVPFVEGKIAELDPEPDEGAEQEDETPDDDAGKKKHLKLPMKIAYSEYTGSTRTRLTEYTLSFATFEKE